MSSLVQRRDRRLSEKSESSSQNARSLAMKIILKKKSAMLNDPLFKQKSKEEQAKELQIKSETYQKLDYMIENIKKYRNEFSGSRVPTYMQKST